MNGQVPIVVRTNGRTNIDRSHVGRNGVLAKPTLNRAGQGRYCITCGHQNPDKVEYCLNCTAPLGSSCPTCSQPVQAGSKFCSQCGTRLASRPPPATVDPQPGAVRPNLRASMPSALAEKINAASVKVAGERREVTVLFLDVTNFTAAAHHLDSEDVYLFIDEAMSLLAEVVYKYEGTVDKFTGDGLMALFGAPVAHENDPERAVRAALEMLAVIQPLQQRIKYNHDYDFQVRIGLNTGPVIAGKVGNDLHMEYTVIGNTVNLAARLESAAAPGTVLVSAETYQRTQPLFEFEALPLLDVKGMPQPISGYRPLALLEKPGRVRGLPGMQVPMVGRAQELAQLQNALSEVCQHHHRMIALVTGEAGLGKSRLVTELRRTLAPSMAKVYQGGCLAYARSRPLWVMADLLRNILHLSEADAGEVQGEVLRAYLDQRGLGTADILPYLTQVLGLEQTDPQLEASLRNLDAAMLQSQTHTALRQLFLAEARQTPTVLIFEDLHWIDPASRDFLEYLIQSTSEVPLLLLFVSREAERKTVIQPLLAAAEMEPERLIDLPLQKLSASEGQLLADQLITQTIAAARILKQHIVERAEGNPFYVEEIIRMLIDQGGLVGDNGNGGWQITPQANELLKAIPGSVKGLILARFDHLPESLRGTLQKAAVLGASFPVSLLQSLNGITSETLVSHLQQLESRQFLRAEPFPSEPGYTFQHALLQEAVYSTLLKRDRRSIHAKVAEAIERGEFWPLEKQTEVLAYHYFESTIPAKALTYLITAAENAERRCAYETAVEHYRRAMTVLPDQVPGAGASSQPVPKPVPEKLEAKPGDQSELFFRVRLGLGRSLKFVGDFANAGQILSETLHNVWGWSPAEEAMVVWPILVDTLRQLADLRQREGNFDEAWTYLDAGLQILGKNAAQEEPRLWRSLVDRLAWIRFRQGQLEEAFALADQAVAGLHSEETDDPIILAKLNNTLGGVSWHQGQLARAIGFVERSLQLYESIGYSWGMATAYGNLGILYDVQGNWSQAATYYEQAYELHLVTGDLQSQANNLDNLGTLHMAMGQHQRAQQELVEGLSIRQRLGDAWGTAQSRVNLAHLAVIRSRFIQAAKRAETALAVADKIKSTEVQIQATWILALAQAEGDDLETALQSAQRALEMARAAGLMEKETDCLRVLGVLRARSGQHLEAEALFHASFGLAHKQNDLYRQGQGLLELGRMSLTVAQTDHAGRDMWRAKALAALNEATEKFKSLGAAHDLRLAEAAIDQIRAER